MRDGDKVLTEHGSSSGTVLEVALEEARKEDRGMQGRGVVVDVHPRGLIFLSETYLDKEPLQFVARGPDASTRFGAAAVLGMAAIALIPALISLCSAIFHAWSTGQVMVVSLGRTETKTEYVPWVTGWARFAGPIVLICSLGVYVGARSLSWRWWMAAAGCAIGLSLLCFSLWFTSLRGTLWFLTGNAFVLGVLYIGKQFMRPHKK